jgi:hypothetical protein
MLQSIFIIIIVPLIVSISCLIILKKHLWIAFIINVLIILILLAHDILGYSTNEPITERIRLFFINDSVMTIYFYYIPMLFFSIFFPVFCSIPEAIKNKRF